MFLDSATPPTYLGLFQSTICRLSGGTRVCRKYLIPSSAVPDHNLLFKLLEKLHCRNSAFIVHVVAWEESNGNIIVYTDSATDTPLEEFYYEVEFTGSLLSENTIWTFVYSMLSAVKEAQSIRSYLLPDFAHMQGTVPVLSLKSFMVNNLGFCRLDVLVYCFNYIFNKNEILQASRNKTLINKNIIIDDIWPYGDCASDSTLCTTLSPPLRFYMESDYKETCPTTKADWLQAETYMIGRILLLLSDLKPAMLAVSDGDDDYYNTNHLYFRGYSIELALIGYRMLYTQGGIRFLASDLLEHDFMIVLKYLLCPPTQDVTCHRIGNQNVTPLILAARSSFPLFIDELVDRYAGMQDYRGKTALMYAAESNSLVYIEHLREKESRLQLRAVNIETDGETALIIAIANGNSNAATLLINEAGMARCDGKTALMVACEQLILQCDTIVDELIAREHGMRTSEGYTALMYATKAGNTHLVRKLMHYEAQARANDGTTALLLAASLGNATICALLIEHEGEYKDNEGCTALIIASKQGMECVVLATIHLAGESNYMGRTALMHAVKYNRQNIVSILSLNEKEMGATDKYGASALSMAAESGNASIVSILLRSSIANKETSLVDKNGWTALIHAARSNHIECVSHLIKTQAGIKDHKGYCAILYAIKWGYIDVVKALLASEGYLLKEQPGLSHLTAIDISLDMANLIKG